MIDSVDSKDKSRQGSATEFEKSVYTLCRLSDRRFVVNPFFSRSNLYAQQIRVLALVKMISSQELLPLGRRNVIVVGAGISGLTAAAAAQAIGATVTLIDIEARLEAPLSQFANATHREFHPTLIQWPQTELIAATDLPFLNWTCLPANLVVQQIRHQWATFHADLVHIKTGVVDTVRETGSIVEVDLKSGEKVKADVVIMATGWEKELKVDGVDAPSYWEARDFNNEPEVVVSGAGDGGVIDAVFQFYGHHATSAARVLAYSLTGSDIASDMKAVEAKSDYDTRVRYYENLRLPSGQISELRQFQKPEPPRVRLVHDCPSIYGEKIAPVNKVMLSASLNCKEFDLNLCYGKLDVGQAGGASICINHQDGVIEEVSTPRIIIRHGARPSVEGIIEQCDIEMLRSHGKVSYSQFVPNEVDWEFYKKSHGARPRQGKISAIDDGQIRAMFAHVCEGDPNYTLTVERNGKWTVHAKDQAYEKLKQVLPIKLRRLTIELVQGDLELSISGDSDNGRN